MKTIKDITEDAINIINGDGKFTGNGEALLRLDGEEIDKYIADLEEKVEELEWHEDDYFTIDKDDIDVIVANMMRKMFYPADDSDYNPTNEEDYESFIDDAVAILKLELEKKEV